MLPELVKVIKEKDVENLSGVTRSVLLIGVILWVALWNHEKSMANYYTQRFFDFSKQLTIDLFFKFKKNEHKSTK